MKLFYILLIPLLLSCCAKPSPIWDDEVTEIIRQDAINKADQILCLEVIREAEENNDTDGFNFYISEYTRIPRLEIKDEWKTHPEYVEGPQR